jgi:lipid-binding SYLF domain-containing protein
MLTRRQFGLSALIAPPLAAMAPRPARALTAEEELVEQARLTVVSLTTDPDYQPLQTYLAAAKAVYVVPALYRGGFIFGAEGGAGVILRRLDGARWSYPAFYLIAGGSFGLQIGGQVAELIMTIMSDRGLQAILDRQVRLGADANASLVAIGAGLEAGTGLDLDADMYGFLRSEGLFAGLSLEGSVITPQRNRNIRYYGRGATAEEVLNGRFVNRQADPLRAALPR